MRRRRSHLQLKGASMAKRKKTIIAGQLVKTVIYTAPEPQDVPKVRAVKSRMTTAAQKAMNDKAARVKLEMLLAANFGPRDLFVTVTYRDKDLPAKRAGAVKNVRSFLKHLREHRRARGQALKYIYTTEDKHGGGRLHHHLVINATGDDIETVRSLWPYGDVLDFEPVGSYDYEQLARYITKESVEQRPVGAQMWTASRNLEKPIVRCEYVANDAALAVPLGCHILEKEERMTEFGSYCYIKYRLPHRYDRARSRRQQDRPQGRECLFPRL